MTGDYDDIFGPGAIRTKFVERVARPEAADEPGPQEASVGSGPYKPYGFLPTGNVGECCDVQRWPPNSEVPEGIEFQYRFLMQIGYVGEEELRLFLPDCIVVIEGRHLRDLRKKLARRQVTFIQQYSARVWPDAPPASEPVIERVEVMRPEALATRRDL